MPLSDDIASLIGLACEAVLYGMYCIIFLTSLYLTFAPSGPRFVNKFIAFTNILLFAVCTTHFAITFNGLYTTLARSGLEGYGDENSVGVGADILISVADWIGEMVLIYRCWVIWGRNYYVVALPCVAATAALGCFAVAVHLLLGMDPTADQPPASVEPFVLAAYILPLCANFLLTALIVGRIWYMSREAAVYTVSSMQGRKSLALRAASIIVESGMLYFVVQAIYLTVFALGNTADEVMSLIAVQIYGIAPTLILIQVGLKLSTEDTLKGSVTNGRMAFARPSQGAHTTRSDATSDYPSIATRFGSVENHIVIAGSCVELQKFSETKSSKVSKSIIAHAGVNLIAWTQSQALLDGAVLAISGCPPSRRLPDLDSDGFVAAVSHGAERHNQVHN